MQIIQGDADIREGGFGTRGFQGGLHRPGHDAGFGLDPETRLPDRAIFLDRLAHALDRAARRPRLLALLLLRVAPSAMPPAEPSGSARREIACAAASSLRALVRRSDTLARLSGIDFGILLEDPHGLDDVKQVAVGLTMALAGTRALGEAHALTRAGIRAFIGIALHACAGQRPEMLLQHAVGARDAALRSPRSGYVVGECSAPGAVSPF